MYIPCRSYYQKKYYISLTSPRLKSLPERTVLFRQTFAKSPEAIYVGEPAVTSYATYAEETITQTAPDAPETAPA